LGGSFYVEWLTDQMEDKIRSLMLEVESYGGAVKAIEDGWLQLRVARQAHERKRNVDSGATPIVGLNCFSHEDQAGAPTELFRLDPNANRRVLEKLTELKDRRDNSAVQRSLDSLKTAAAKDNENLLPYLIDCCHAYATVGEMVQQLKLLWGEFREPVRL
jgi:methylmalonyl-CoA mutase N-terminal domain/subunit